MEMKILDEFPPWSIYIMALFIACGFLTSVVILIRSCYGAAYDQRASRKAPRFSRPALIFSIAGALALWFFITSMFFRFHAIAIGPHRVELVYFWPRPRVTIGMRDLDEVKIVPGGRTCGYMEIATQDQVFDSVSFKHCKVAQEIRVVLAERAGLRQR